MESGYLLLGPEIGEKNAFVDKLRAELVKALGVKPEEERYYCQDMKPGELVSMLLNGSLFAPHRLVTYSGIELISAKGDIATLSGYLRSPAPDVTLIMVSDGAGADKALKDAVGEKGCKVFWEMFEDRKEEWLRSFFRREGFKISSQAVDAILELVENNTEALKTECSRLALFLPKDREIGEDDIENYLSHNRSEDAFSLFDRMASDGLEEALECLEKILSSKEGEPIGVLAGLSWSFKRLEGFQRLKVQGMNGDEAFLRSGIKSKKLQATYRDADRRYPLEVCRKVLSRLLDADFALRSLGGSMEKTVMQKALYETMVKQGRAIEAIDQSAR
jgi:DNA polymerase III subunit delta